MITSPPPLPDQDARPTEPAVPPVEEPLRWAGHGHVGAFLMQAGILISVNLALWGVVLLMAMKFAGVLGDPVLGQ